MSEFVNINTVNSGVSKSGNRLLIVETSSSGGGQWYRPGFLSLVEIEARTEFRTVKSKNVIRVIARNHVDLRNQGPRSAYRREFLAMTSLFEMEDVTEKKAA